MLTPAPFSADTNSRFFTPKVSDLYTLSSEIGCQFWGIEENNIGHNLRSALIGPNMELLKIWEGDEWLAKNVTRDIKDYMKIMK